jgi:hypothetical protein
MMTDKESRIRERAYALWEATGQPHGKAADHWAEASSQIEAEDQALATEPTPKETAGTAKRSRTPRGSDSVGQPPAAPRKRKASAKP